MRCSEQRQAIRDTIDMFRSRCRGALVLVCIMSLSRETFEQLEEPFAVHVKQRGFSRENHEYDGPFGSHYVDFTLGSSAYRLIGDGRESSIFLDFSAHYYRPIPQQDWVTLLHRPYPPSFSPAAIASIVADIQQTLNSHAKHNEV